MKTAEEWMEGNAGKHGWRMLEVVREIQRDALEAAARHIEQRSLVIPHKLAAAEIRALMKEK